jgi:glycerophosphoryl diester phosphodiesterase
MRSVPELVAALAAVHLVTAAPVTPREWEDWHHTQLAKPTPKTDYYVSYGPRPYFTLQNMTEGPLKTKLESCQNGPFEITGWSIGHRGGATLQIPEETAQSTEAGARMGAGVLECDVAFTADRGLVCRHSLCDLHTTTDILVRPELAAKCTVPFTPANDTADATAICCTSDITLEEYEGLCGKMDGFNASVRGFRPGPSAPHAPECNSCVITGFCD